MAVRIIIDSTADTTDAVRAKCAVVPMTVRFGDTEYVDGVTISRQEFYEKLVRSDELPTTSQPAPEAFAQIFRQVAQDGDTAVVLTVSGALSGTYQSATIAAMDFPDSIYVVDSQNVAIGTGILAELAVQLAESGMSAKQIAEELTAAREKVCLIAVLDTLTYLKKGGRISATAAVAGELLSIKPLVTIRDGVVQILGKARGLRQANATLTKEALALEPDLTAPYILGYTGTDDTPVRTYLSENTSLWGTSPNVAIVSSAIGTHAGPGAHAVAFFRK